MGAWSPALYSDDTTAEIRDNFKEYLESGLSHPEASSEILKSFEKLLADHRVVCLVYFALADTQWKYGCLDERVKSRALELINAGGDLEVWRQDSPKQVNARAKVLATLRTKLLSQQPPLKKVKLKTKKLPRKLLVNLPGSLFGLKLPNGSVALLKFVGSWLEEPLFRLLPWQGHTLPAASEIETISEQFVPLSGHPEFGLQIRDGRKNPISYLIQTELVVGSKIPINRSQLQLINVEFLPTLVQKALDNFPAR